MEREHPELCQWGDMKIWVLRRISEQVSHGTVVQFHNNGEPTLYPHLGWALSLFKGCIRQFNTNAIMLMECADEIIGNLEALTISVIPKDPEAEAQFETVRQFLAQKGDRRPQMVYRLLGDVEKPERWRSLPGIVATRVLHSPDGSRDYERTPVVPEIGVCLELLTHLAVDRRGNISLCVRYDPMEQLLVGNIMECTLEEAWNGEKRQTYIRRHVRGRRDLCPGCDRCEFWGIARGE
jgi:radical SAM protein with 4Fe4S-binding SPASM domain